MPRDTGEPAFRAVVDRRTIQEGQRRLVRGLVRAAATPAIRCSAGFQGGQMDIDARWLPPPLGIWFASKVIRNAPTPRYWNVFGTSRPRAGQTVQITCEINFPLTGVHRNVGGLLVTDTAGQLHIVHRGTIGGGRKGIGKALFFGEFSEAMVSVLDGTARSTLALVADLDSPRFAQQIALFVREVEEIKAHRGRRQARPPWATKHLGTAATFRSEPESRRSFWVEGWRQPNADHGLVVNELRRHLHRLGLHVVNDRRRDLLDALQRLGRLGIGHVSYDFARDGRVAFQGLEGLVRRLRR